MELLNEKTKKMNWFTRNHYFAGTLLLIVATFVCYYTVNTKCKITTSDFHFYQMLASTFGHGGLGHLCGNMITLVFVGLFFERKFGTICLIIIYPVMAVLSCFAVMVVNSFNLHALGASSTINGFYGIYFICLIFDFKVIKENKVNITVYILCFICFFTAMFIKLPGLTNWGEIYRDVHYPGFLMGVVLALVCYIFKYFRKNRITESVNKQIN